MESNSNTSYESLLFNGKSSESSDCEGYGTPLASSLTDLHVARGELTPVSSRAISPACVREIMYLQKSNNLVMTQRMLSEEDIRRMLEQGEGLEEEFFDTADEEPELEDIAVDSESEEKPSEDDVAEVTASLLEKVADIEPVNEHDVMQVVQVEENVVLETSQKADEEEVAKVPMEEVEGIQNVVENVEITPEVVAVVQDEVGSEKVEDVTMTIDGETLESDVSADVEEVDNSEEEAQEAPVDSEVVVELESCESEDTKVLEIVDVRDSEEVIQLSEDVAETVPSESEVIESEDIDTSQGAPDAAEIVDIVEQLTEAVVDRELELMEEDQSPEAVEQLNAKVSTELIPQENHQHSQEVTVTIADDSEAEVVTATTTIEVSPVSYSSGLNTLDSGVSEQTSSNSSESGKLLYTPVSVQLLKSKFEAPASLNKDTLPTLVNSDEVKATSGGVKLDIDADNDADCELDGESLSSSTSTESFEFAESIPSPFNSTRSPESTQALRNSINERYPSHETDEELDNEFDDDLLAVKQISAEVEQLVAAINAFGRDEEQQMSAYLVGKNMAAEKKRKMDASSSFRSDQLVQTDSDFILVDRHIPEVMESLQAEIARLQADLTSVKLGEKELQKLNAKLQDELQESQQTIDGIEVEAEQQYTELTSEIDELCTIVLKKDEELANLKEKVANLSVSEINHKDDVDAQRVIVQRQKEIIEGLREELDNLTKKLSEVTKSRDKAIEDVTIYKMKNMERDRFLSKEAQMSMEIEDLQRELNKQKLILNNTSMAKLADTFDRKVLHLENELRERDMLICKQNQIINSHRKSPTGVIITQRKMQPRASVLAAAGNLNSAGSSSESFQNGLDIEAKEALLSFILSDRHNQLANIYNIGRILDLTSQEERAVERHLTKDRFT